MTIISKYVALKNYIPTGLPKEEDFEIKSKTLELDETNNIHVLNSWISVDPYMSCLLYTSPSPRDATLSRMPSSA